MPKRLVRQEVPSEQTWNLADIFPGVPAWEAELAAVGNDILTVTQYQGKLGNGARVLLSCLNALEDLQKRFMKVASYAQLNQSADGTAPANQAMAAQAMGLGARIQAATSFIRSEILALPAGTIEGYLTNEPGLVEYRRFLERILTDKPYALSPETERALAALSEVLGAPALVYARSKSSDMTFAPVKDGQGNELPMSFAVYEGRYEDSADAVLRHNAYFSFTQGLKAYQNTYATTWATEVRKNVVLARLRGHPSATHMILHQQEVPIEVYNNLHDIILKELAPHMRRYVGLRKQVLGLDKLLYCDIEAPLDPEYNPPTTFEQSGEIILQGLSVLGPEYLEIIAAALKNRWIDWADNVGKSTGAFCNSLYGVHPYILITWTNSLLDALTLAHELGHAGHGVLSQRYNHLLNSRSSMFFVEAPSTINSLLVADSLLAKTTDQRMRRWIIMKLLAIYHHNFVRHLIEGELQRRIYALAEKDQPVTASVLSRVQGEILDEFWGGEVEIDDGARLTWMRQPHYYNGLYPYTYSAGLTVGTAMAQTIRAEGEAAVKQWLAVLKSGGTKKPLELAQMAGVDLTRPEPIRQAVAYVGSLVNEVVNSF
ncbi:MAG: oligoendopeptidase F [Firmicutes bacterium]|nr:oligoendopeptidase F [Bacillota bacterium]MCL5038645.1 oligoendopeptidase F [Bacillota bacterium]